MLIDARLVRQEILINSEGGFNRAIGVDLLLHVIRRHSVDRFSMVARSLVFNLVALGGGLRRATGLVVRSVDMMLAGREGVRILGFSGEAVHFEEAPGAGGVAALATHAALQEAAR